MADTYFVGLRATDDVVSNEREESWRNGVRRLFPNGMAPLTALTSLMPSKKVTDPHYHWWTKTLTTQRSAITTVNTDAQLAVAYTGTSGAAGDTLYLKIPAAGINMFRIGHQVLLRDASDYRADSTGKITAVVSNGANSYLAVLMIQGDDDANAPWTGLDTVSVIGSINAQGATRPEAITQSPTEFENYTQIWRNPLDLSRTLMETKLRTEKAYQEAKKDALEQHSIEMEKSLLWSTLYITGTGSNGKPEYATRGLMSWINEYGTVQDYTLDSAAAYAGKNWLQMGDEWLDEHLEEIFRFGAPERLAFCGSGALLGIQKIAKDRGDIVITPQTTAWGSNVREWITPFGVLTLQTHPLFSFEATNRNSMVIIEPKNLGFNFITDTMFMPDTQFGKGGGTGYDGKVEEYLTEGGLMIDFPETTGFLNGVGLDNLQ